MLGSATITIDYDIRNVKLAHGCTRLQMFPTSRKGAPENLQTGLVKPSALLLTYVVGLNVTFSSDIRTEVDSLLSEASCTRGSATIFGWEIGGANSSSRTTPFHDVKWEKHSGSLFQRVPTLGVLGSRLD